MNPIINDDVHGEAELLGAMQMALSQLLQKEFAPLMQEDEEQQRFRPELYAQLGHLGLLSMTAPQTDGGQGLSLHFFCQLLEQLSRTSVSYSITVSVSIMVMQMIARYGTAAQKMSYLPGLMDGTAIGSFALSESHAGSDPASMTTQAKRQPNGDYLINGNKLWITSAGLSKVYLVIARAEEGVSAFLVDAATPGLSLGPLEKKMGWHISPTREVIFNQCRIPAENILGAPGEGLKVALSGLNRGRITIAAVALGLAQEALERAINFALEREQFKQKIWDFQGLQFLLAEQATELQAARYLVLQAAQSYDQGKPSTILASMAKLKATDMAMTLATEAVQIHGGVGITREYTVERLMRDAKILQIVEGTNQIQKVIIARELKKTFAGTANSQRHP